jgi:transposase-like protein
MSQKYGVNASEISSVVPIKQETAWNILYKVRRTMLNADKEKLGPKVEVDLSYFSTHKNEKTRKNVSERKNLIVLATEIPTDGKKQGRIKLATIDNTKNKTLTSFIKNNVEPGSTVVTDGWNVSNSLIKLGFKHKIILMDDDEKLLPHVHKVYSLLNEWIYETFHGVIKEKLLQFYLDEYCYRVNCMSSKSHGKLFRLFMEQAVITPSVTRNKLR